MHTHQRFYLTHELMRGQVTGCSRFKDFREPRAGSEFTEPRGKPAYPGQIPALHPDMMPLHFYGQESLALSSLFYH